MLRPQQQTRFLPLLTLAGALIASPLLHAEEKSLRRLIDAEVRAAWQREKIVPAGRASDAAFLRRVYLDLAGTIPSRDETQQFLQDTHANKRELLIDKLLADARFSVHQANVWDLVLFGRHPSNGEATRKREGFTKWLADKFARNEPYDRWVRDLLLAEQPGTELFHVQYRNQPADAAVAVTRIFLGTQLQCARCHDHPFESWTQRDFYGMAGFFVRLVVIDKGNSAGQRRYAIGEKSTGEVLFTGAVKDQKPGQKGEPIKAKFLGGPALEEKPPPKGFKEPALKPGKEMPRPSFSRKEKLAAWVTAPDNPYLARAVVNRVWAQFLGKGLVHPVDDLRETNAPRQAELFKVMTDQLKSHQFDLKWLIRELVNSETYQLAAEGSVKDALPSWYERARVRPLSAEELAAAIQRAVAFDPAGRKMVTDARPYFLMYFGEPTNGRGEFQGRLSGHLFLNNSDHIRRMIQRRKGNLADLLLVSKEPWERRVEQLFLSVLSRPPSGEERKKFVAYLTTDGKPEVLVEEAIWVLLNTAEFRFNH
ncbi:MAG TPA: DUF1549 domain-containing protein [Gemmataceae bacterium]|nr:DUF1549 domain-containing protein [Gemmataceae bacterium]